jgi:hypothetical protein
VVSEKVVQGARWSVVTGGLPYAVGAFLSFAIPVWDPKFPVRNIVNLPPRRERVASVGAKFKQQTQDSLYFPVRPGK